MVFTLRHYLRSDGSSPFRAWFEDLDDATHARVTRYMTRLELGNTSNVKSVGEGVNELKMDFGPGYRVYFGFDGRTLIILLGGGSKKKQDDDIEAAKAAWKDYKKRSKKDDD